MWRHSSIILCLISCNAWIRPTPKPPLDRTPEDQKRAAVSIVVTCDIGGFRRDVRTGSGVMVSDWQVLTARHVVQCDTAIPIIKVANRDGSEWNFAPEKEWLLPDATDGIARIQMASGDSLSPRLRPPTIYVTLPDSYDPLFLQAGSPRFEEHVEEATGWTYGRAMITYGGFSEDGNSGAGVYDMSNRLLNIHLGKQPTGRKYGMLVTKEMVP